MRPKPPILTGEYAVKPYINGQGSAEVFNEPEYIDSPLECLRRLLPEVQIDYFDYLPNKKPDKMLWHYFNEKMPGIRDYDLVLVFTGVSPKDTPLMPVIENILVDDFKCEGSSVAVQIEGVQGYPMRSVYLKDVYAKGGVNVQTNHVANLCMENVNFE